MTVRSHEVVVHLVDPDAIDPDELARARLDWLAPDERARYARYVFPEGRHEYLVTRVLARQVLGRRLSRDPTALAFDVGPYGRPELRAESAPPGRQQALRFNLSNTRGLIACAVALDHDVGVDVEFMDRKTETVAVADRFFSAAEVRALHELPEREQRRRFFELWTLKEAYIKARGLGLAIPLGSFSFAFPRGATPTIAFDDESLPDQPRAWYFEQQFPSTTHALALAVRPGDEENIRSVFVWETLSF